jgi:hypothetical protein
LRRKKRRKFRMKHRDGNSRTSLRKMRRKERGEESLGIQAQGWEN